MTDDEKVKWLASVSPHETYPSGLDPYALMSMMARHILDLQERLGKLEHLREYGSYE